MTSDLFTGARVAQRSGVLAPIGPAALLRTVSAVNRNGRGLPTLAAVAAARWPDQVAVIDDLGRLSYAQLAERVDLLAGALEVEHGLAGGRVVLMCRNHRGFIEGLLASARIGADVMLANTDFPAPQLAQVLGGRSFDGAIVDGEFVDKLAEAGYAGPVIVADGGGIGSTSDLISRCLRPAAKPARMGAITLLTSGTTGVPKGAPRVPSPRAVAGVSISAIDRLGLRANETMLIAPPLFHGFGLTQLALGLALGSTMVLHRRFDAAQVLSELDEHAVTHLAVVPVMLQRLLASRSAGAPIPGSLRSVLTGAAPLSPALCGEFMDVFGEVLFNGYGSSEVGIVTIATPADLRRVPGTVGSPVINTSVRILDEEGHPVAAGEIGGIYIASPMVFDGYTSGDDKHRVADAASTGDRGYVDAAGCLTIVGREDDMILSGGENVYPQELEDVLAAYPDVADVAVIAVDDEEFGQRLKAFIVLRPGGSAGVEELTTHIRSQVARYKVPREIVLLDELPRNPTGKVLKRALPR
jgi:acyl-CoA synthetase (AMP-forming)/AMP-acid ligase II